MSSEEQAKDERDSLNGQERAGRAWAEANDAKIVDVLKVSFSRDYRDLNECNQDMKKHGYYALDTLIELWESKPMGLDGLWCRDLTRIGRTGSLLTRVVEEIIDRGGRIYSQAEGWIDAQNGAMQAAFQSVAHYR
ncbi:MAG: recombinase family protein [Chloroflexota bacterium]